MTIGNSAVSSPSDSGSRWHRWEPHVHAPGTVLNNQFKGDDAWERYLAALEAADPLIRALGITDYYDLSTYERICVAKQNNRLSGCDLIFPNIEMRLNLGTVKGAWVNLHLLVSPDDPNHVDEVKRLLSRLTFLTAKDTFACTPEDLIKLGRVGKPELIDDRAALSHGTEQFKVSFDQLREVFKASAWAQANILVAVAGGDDGTSGLRAGADTTLRQEVERFAHVIFASSPSQRDFWLGRKALTAAEIRTRYDGLKPCLHGSDAHAHSTTGAPDGNRYSWIKGALIFDALRQACIDPAGRAYIGDTPPTVAMPSQVISKVNLENACWAQSPALNLNPGLIAIIGSRGSGKTALADIIAAGCDALPEKLNEQSFLHRAREYLSGASVQLGWQTGDLETRTLDGSEPVDFDRYPRARYLSQQFVEDLCASDRMTDALLSEIERVVFNAHDTNARDGAVDFDELRDLKAQRHRQAREREELALASLSERIGTEIEKDKLIASCKTQVTEKSQVISRQLADRSKLIAIGSKERVARLDALTKAAAQARNNVRYFIQQRQQLQSLQDIVRDVRNNQAPEGLRALRGQYAATGLNADEWANFLLGYTGDVDAVLSRLMVEAEKNSSGWKGVTPQATDTALVPIDTDLTQQPLALLEAEMSRIEKLIGVDRTTAEKFGALSKKMVEDEAALVRLKEKLLDFEGARSRIQQLQIEREASYTRVFQAVLAEQEVLTALYAPIRDRLSTSTGSLQKLSFSVARVADLESWAKHGEDLLDLRRQGPFRGRGSLQQAAEALLKKSWETGDGLAVAAAMAKFRTEHQEDLLAHAPVPRTNQVEYRAWSKRFAKWLYGTDHISVRYSVDYDGIDIRKLSPGTRGIVLLLLYLALDTADDRPLIIDQPEENLDPKSIYDELVGLFLEAKAKRQVIIVTHNANLVINTDADQIIIASAGPHVAGDLPPITYISGGLERPEIRQAVCEILEGGEDAFRERARRLRVRLDR
jgi:hypothetical protein